MGKVVPRESSRAPRCEASHPPEAHEDLGCGNRGSLAAGPLSSGCRPESSTAFTKGSWHGVSRMLHRKSGSASRRYLLTRRSVGGSGQEISPISTSAFSPLAHYGKAMVAVMVQGWLLGLLAHSRKNLRPGMLA